MTVWGSSTSGLSVPFLLELHHEAGGFKTILVSPLSGQEVFPVVASSKTDFLPSYKAGLSRCPLCFGVSICIVTEPSNVRDFFMEVQPFEGTCGV